MKLILVPIILLISVFVNAQSNTKNVILITLDGTRWQEVFSGADKELILDKDFVSDSARIVNKFWNEDASKRRELLMPFFWTVIKKQGQLYGNRTLGNKVNVSNNQWFSYPGYSEILTGFADNERIHSNDKFDNPNKNVLEFINQKNGFQGKVAAYSSWDVFPFIINAKRNGLPVNSGLVPAQTMPNEKEKLLNELMVETTNPLGDVRLDAFTFHYAFEYLKKNKPRVLFISFDETDDYAHGGKYDLYLEGAQHIDGMIRKLWEYVQSNEPYKDKTTVIITTDHGRGHLDKNAWRDHGSKVPDADQIWIAILGPDTPILGEVQAEGQLFQNQIAKTLAQFLGLQFVNENREGKVIPTAFKK